MTPRPPTSPLFPYTTLFRSVLGAHTLVRRAVLQPARGAHAGVLVTRRLPVHATLDRKSTRLNSSHITISYAVFCLKKKKKQKTPLTLVNHPITIHNHHAINH